MRRFGIVGLVAAFAVMFVFSSCAKRDAPNKGITKRETGAMMPEQTKKKEEIRKGVEESKRLVVARVNGSDITMYSLVKEMNSMAPRFVPGGQPATPEMTAKVKKEALNN